MSEFSTKQTEPISDAGTSTPGKFNILSVPKLDDIDISAPDIDSTTGTTRNFPDFRQDAKTQYYLRKSAQRKIVAQIDPDEFSALLAERVQLLNKQFGGTITYEESNRLEYVRWTLSRIEDAKNGEALDLLEAGIDKYEDFLMSIEEFSEKIESVRKMYRNRNSKK